MTALAEVPAKRLIRAIADAAERFADADFPPRVRVLDHIVERTGYSLPVVEYALDQLFTSITAPDLEAVVRSEIGSLSHLDEVGGAGRVCIISSRTTIGVAIVPAVFALLAKCEVLVKDREDALVRTFFGTLAMELPELEAAAVAQEWRGEEDAVDLAAFDVVVAFGSDETLDRIRERTRPETLFIGYGSKASIGYIAKSALSDEASALEIADGAARDLVLYESEGCMSLHALFVEDGGEIAPQHFAALLARAIKRAAVEFPPGDLDVASRASLAQARDLAAFRAAGGQGAVFSDPPATYLVAVDPPRSQPPFFLPRAIGVHAVGNPDEALAYLADHRIHVEAIALAPNDESLIDALADSGAHRFTAFGDLQRPPIGGKHGGRPRIAEFVRKKVTR